jgi:hypothetical protein
VKLIINNVYVWLYCPRVFCLSFARFVSYCVCTFCFVLFCHLCAVCCIVLAPRNLSCATCLHFVSLNRSGVKLLDKVGKPKSVTLALDRLVIRECVFDDVTILFHFWFGESAGLEKILFR